MVEDHGLYSDSRTVQENNGGFTVSIPKEIADRYGIEKGDQVWWRDGPEDENPQFKPPRGKA